jgi:hypothetical protein
MIYNLVISNRVLEVKDQVLVFEAAFILIYILLYVRLSSSFQERFVLVDCAAICLIFWLW